MSRPRKNEEKNRPERVAFRITRELKAKMEAARTDEKSMGDIANEALEQYFAKRRRTEKDRAA